MAETYTLIKDTPSLTIHKTVIASGSSRAFHCQGARSVTIVSGGNGTLLMYPPDADGNPDVSASVELDNALGVSDSTSTKVGMIDRLSMPPWFGLSGNTTHYILISWEQAGA